MTANRYLREKDLAQTATVSSPNELAATRGADHAMHSAPYPGMLLVLEGPEGVGKTVVSRELAIKLAQRGIGCEYIALPSGRMRPSEIACRIAREEGDAPEELDLFARRQLQLDTHAEAIQQRIRPALEAGNYVLLDHYWWSSYVYGELDGLGSHQLQEFKDRARVLWEDTKPSVVILLDRERPFSDPVDLLQWFRLREVYRQFAASQGKSTPVSFVENTKCLATVVAQIEDIVIGLSQDEPKQASFPAEFWDTKRTTSHLAPVRPSPIYDLYWQFAAERQRIYRSRLSNDPPPWTSDPILSKYRFTNAYRASDRVSQYLIRHVIYREDLPTTNDEVFFRILLFKLFNRISTWEVLEDSLGPIAWETYSFSEYDRVLSRLLGTGQPVYSAAYIMPSGGRHWGASKETRESSGDAGPDDQRSRSGPSRCNDQHAGGL